MSNSGKEKTRTEYSMKNATVAFIGKVLVLIFAYAARVVFVHVLSTEYAGANGLLSSVLGVFSLWSLGIDAALTYLLYKPVADNDICRQQVLMRVYRRVHLITAGIIAAIAAVMFFLMPYISRESLDIPGFTYVYWLFAGNVIMGYVFSHKPMIFIATQQNYINELFESAQLIAQAVIQSVLLIITKDFVLYTVVYFLSIIIKNIVASIYAEKKYPYLRQKNNSPLMPEDKREIRRNLWAILLQKFGVKIINYTDAVILSSFFGIVSVAKYTNYDLIIVSIRQLMEKVIYSITGSVGNLNVTTDKESVEKIYNASLFITIVIFGVISICLYEVFESFVKISFGERYVYDKGITLVLCINLFMNGIRIITTVFKNSVGIFWHDRYRSIAEAILNIVYSLGAIYIFGEIGIFLGTTFSLISVPLWVEPLVLYKNYFKKPLYKYFLLVGTYTVGIVAAFFLSDLACGFVTGSSIVQFAVKGLLSFAITIAVITLLYHRTSAFRFMLKSVLSVIRKKSK